jgi:adenylate cyclase class IV
MATNVEIKARVPSLDGVRERALRLSSRRPEVLEQTDTFFVVPAGRLKVREFADGSGELISYHRLDRSGPKASSYLRCVCDRPRELVDTLAQVLPVRGVVRKRREVIHIGQTRVHLDQVEHLGCFVELEVVLSEGQSLQYGEAIAHRLIEDLAIPEGSLIEGAYVDLLSQNVLDRGLAWPE